MMEPASQAIVFPADDQVIGGDKTVHVIMQELDVFDHFHQHTIREQTVWCGSGTGLKTDEIMELRMRAGLPRANAVKL